MRYTRTCKRNYTEKSVHAEPTFHQWTKSARNIWRRKQNSRQLTVMLQSMNLQMLDEFSLIYLLADGDENVFLHVSLLIELQRIG